MKKEELKRQIIYLMDRFIAINFENYIKVAKMQSNSQIDEEGMRKIIDNILEIFITIKNDDSLLDAFTPFKLLKINNAIDYHMQTIASSHNNYKDILNNLNDMNNKLASFKLDEVIKKISSAETKDNEVTKEISLTETKEAIKFFQDNKKDYKKAKDIFEEAIKNKDDLIAKNILITSFDFANRRKKVEYIINIENKKSSWPAFLNSRNFWWFSLGLIFAGIALCFLWHIQKDGVINNITIGAALLRISSVIILTSLSSFCFLQFSNNKKLKEFYEFKVLAINTFERLSKTHISTAAEKHILFIKAFDIIFKEHSFKERSFKDNNVKNFLSQIKDFEK